jgi:hypothetical protein
MTLIPTQETFKCHFKTGVHVKVPDRDTINNWVEEFQTTASATNKKLGSYVRTMWTPADTEREQATTSHSPTSHAFSCPQQIQQISSSHSFLHHPYKTQAVQEL